MDSESATLPQMLDNGLCEAITITQIYVASQAILIYASLLHFADEVEYMWKRKFTLITWLYIFSKYSVLFYQSLIIILSMLPTSSYLRVCDDLETLAKVVAILSFIGQQGSLSILTYVLCQGYRPVTIALSITLSTSIILQIYLTTVTTCIRKMTLLNAFTLPLITNILLILLDTLAFIGVIHQIRRFCNLKGQGFVTFFLRQGILVFSFVVFIAITATTLTTVKFGSTPSQYITAAAFFVFQTVLSPILTCEFTLNLRRQNTPKSITDQSGLGVLNLTFQSNPIQSIRSVLGRLHEDIVGEIGEGNDSIDIDNAGETDMRNTYSS